MLCVYGTYLHTLIPAIFFVPLQWLNAWCGGCNQRIPYNDRLGVKFLRYAAALRRAMTVNAAGSLVE